MSRSAGEWPPPPPRRQPAPGLPLLLWVLAGATVLANLGGVTWAGYRVSGLAWLLTLAFAFIVVMRNPTLVVFPLWTWAPWILVITVFWHLSRFPSLQRTVQLLCPLVMACAASTFRLEEEQLQRLLTMIRGLAAVLVAIVLVETGILATGALPFFTGLAPQVMTTMMLGCLFAASYAGGQRGDLGWWLVMGCVPVVALTRTAIVATALTLPLTVAPLKVLKRVVLLLVVILVGWQLFSTSRIQEKMFRSGSGGMRDVLDADITDSGRFFMWTMMKEGIKDKLWLGHGAGAGEVFVRNITAGQSGYPHNDWLLTLYDYGITGTAAFVISLLAAAGHAFMCAGRARGVTRLLLLTGVSAFVPFAIMMYTDNIMVYVSYFGNLQFAILGLGYGALQLQSGSAIAVAAPHD